MASEANLPPDSWIAKVMIAAQRAALRARLIACQTGTPLVFFENGKIRKVKVPPEELRSLQEKLGMIRHRR